MNITSVEYIVVSLLNVEPLPENERINFMISVKKLDTFDFNLEDIANEIKLDIFGVGLQISYHMVSKIGPKTENVEHLQLMMLCLKLSIALKHCGVDIDIKNNSYLIHIEAFCYKIDLKNCNFMDLKIFYNLLLKKYLINHIEYLEDDVPYFYFYRINLLNFAFESRIERFKFYKKKKFTFEEFCKNEIILLEYYHEIEKKDDAFDDLKNEFVKFIQA